MSLINQALRRAQTEKLRNSPYFDNLTVLPPSDDEMAPPPILEEDEPSPRSRTWALPVLSLALLACAAAGVLYLWLRSAGQAGPEPALAAAPVQHPALPAPEPTAPNAPPPLAPPAPKPSPSTPPVAPKLVEAAPAEPAPALAPPAPAPLAGPTTKPSPAPTTRAAPEPARTAPPTGPAKALVLPVRPVVATFDPGSLKLTAIMRGPGGPVALIDGLPLQEGQSIEGATIAEIRPHSVELVHNGRRHTLRMRR